VSSLRVPYKITNIVQLSQEIVKKRFLFISATFSKILMGLYDLV